jgi:hypothetical protein
MTTDNKQRTTDIRIEIGELVLRGFNPRLRYEIGGMVERELARLIGERGWREGLSSAVRLDGRMFEVDAGAPPEQIGARIASAVYAACGGQSE